MGSGQQRQLSWPQFCTTSSGSSSFQRNPRVRELKKASDCLLRVRCIAVPTLKVESVIEKYKILPVFIGSIPF